MPLSYPVAPPCRAGHRDSSGLSLLRAQARSTAAQQDAGASPISCQEHPFSPKQTVSEYPGLPPSSHGIVAPGSALWGGFGVWMCLGSAGRGSPQTIPSLPAAFTVPLLPVWDPSSGSAPPVTAMGQALGSCGGDGMRGGSFPSSPRLRCRKKLLQDTGGVAPC